MKYMWICHKLLAPTYVRKCLTDIGSSTVIRRLTFSDRVCWVFISDFASYEWADHQQMTDYDSDYWSISSCNKQYVTNERTGKYAGALGEVDLFEARKWVAADDKNWYLSDTNTDQVWIPLQRNPNKMIPTGAPGYCRHCGNTSAQTPGNRYRPLYRPWPLSVDA